MRLWLRLQVRRRDWNTMDVLPDEGQAAECATNEALEAPFPPHIDGILPTLEALLDGAGVELDQMSARDPERVLLNDPKAWHI